MFHEKSQRLNEACKFSRKSCNLWDGLPVGCSYKCQEPKWSTIFWNTNVFFCSIGVKRTFFNKKHQKNENVHEMGRRASKIDFSHTKMRIFSRLSAW